MHRFFSRHSSQALDYRILFFLFVTSYLIYPLFYDFKPFNLWLTGCLLLLVVSLGYCFPLKQINVVSRFSSMAFIAINSRYFRNSLVIILAFQVYLIISARSYDTTGIIVQDKINLAVDAQSNSFIRYLSYAQSSFPLIALIYLESKIQKLILPGTLILLRNAVQLILVHCKLPVLILLLSSSSYSKVGFGAALTTLGFLFSPYLSSITTLIFFSVIFFITILSFFSFFLNSGILQSYDYNFIIYSIYLRLLGTSHDALNAINQIYALTGSINYPFKSIFYPLGFFYTRFLSDFLSVGFWLEKTAYGNTWGGGPNPGFIGDYVLAIPFALSLFLCYFFGANMRFSVQSRLFPITFSFIFYNAIVDLHTAIVYIFMTVFLSFVCFFIERIVSLSVLSVFKW